MHSTLIVARMDPGASEDVARIFSEFDRTQMPALMGTIRRQLYTYRGLYFHLQDFAADNGEAAIAEAKTHPAFVKVSADLKPFIEAYDPATWRSPADAMAKPFYRWSSSI